MPSDTTDRHQRAIALRAEHGLGDPADDPDLIDALARIVNASSSRRLARNGDDYVAA